MKFPEIVLKKGREESIKRYHPWIFSGAIKSILSQPQEGEIVKVLSEKGEVLGLGHFQHSGSISVRLFAFTDVVPDNDFWFNKLFVALQKRIACGITSLEHTNAWRLFHGEADGIPGLIIDYYDEVIVIQAHTSGVYKMLEILAEQLNKLFNHSLKAIYNKSEETLPHSFKQYASDGFLSGSSEDVLIMENGAKFWVNFVQGQKTGFFLDQRDNRKYLKTIASGKKVLNAFSYSGGFSVYAALGGAVEVHSVDSSEKACNLARRNIVENGFSEVQYPVYQSEVIPFLQKTHDMYDIIVLDPPAFAKHLSARHNAVQGYKRLNELALRKIKSGGFLATFSCSQAVDNVLFENTIRAAAIQSGRNCQVVHHFHQGADHPISIFHPEGEYLKGLLLFVE